jgi:hypothetical protein
MANYQEWNEQVAKIQFKRKKKKGKVVSYNELKSDFLKFYFREMTGKDIRREIMKYKASSFCFSFVNMYVVFGFPTCLLNCLIYSYFILRKLPTVSYI